MRKTSTVAFVSLLATLVVATTANAASMQIWDPGDAAFGFEGVEPGTFLNPDLGYDHAPPGHPTIDRGKEATFIQEGGAHSSIGMQHAHVGKSSEDPSGTQDLIRYFDPITSDKHWRFSMAFRSLDTVDSFGNIHEQAATIQFGDGNNNPFSERYLWIDLYRRIGSKVFNPTHTVLRTGFNGNSQDFGPALGPPGEGDGVTPVTNSTDWFHLFIDMEPWNDAPGPNFPYTVTVYNITEGGTLVGSKDGTTTDRESNGAPGVTEFTLFNIIADPNRGIDMDHLSLVMSDEALGAHVAIPEPASLAMLVAGGLMVLRRGRRS